MESYKDVIVSQKPAMYQQGKQPSGILLENYKGILLCAHPVDIPHGPSTQLRSDTGGAAPLLTGSGEPAPAFVPGGKTEEPLGLGPSVEGRMAMERGRHKQLENHRARRAEVSTAISRHRRWLRSFAEQVRRMKDEEIQREVNLARRAECLRRQYQSQKRNAEATCSPCVGTDARHPAMVEDKQQQHHPEWRAVAADDNGGGRAAPPADDDEKKKKRKSAKSKKKPKWALTEDEALDDELAEANDLLEFAKKLDYEKFISDYEVAGALAIMRERVEEIARENNWSKEAIELAANDSVAGDTDDDDDDDDDEEGGGDLCDESRVPRPHVQEQRRKNVTIVSNKAAERKAAGHTKGWDSSVSVGCVLKRAIMRDALQLAERILASSASMQKIHTKFSLARLLQRCVLNGTDVKEAMQKPSIGGNTGLATVPRIVKLHPDATGLERETGGADAGGQQRVLLEMQRSKERTQGLPYLYRCPAI